LHFDADNQLLVSIVEDTGIGIKEEDLNKLFKYFGCVVKSKNINQNGMGLGLTISKMIVQQLGGQIFCESQYGKGSKFEFNIPTDSIQIPTLI
jgi:signal transduction histidine kinase